MWDPYECVAHPSPRVCDTFVGLTRSWTSSNAGPVPAVSRPILTPSAPETECRLPSIPAPAEPERTGPDGGCPSPLVPPLVRDTLAAVGTGPGNGAGGGAWSRMRPSQPGSAGRPAGLGRPSGADGAGAPVSGQGVPVRLAPMARLLAGSTRVTTHRRRGPSPRATVATRASPLPLQRERTDSPGTARVLPAASPAPPDSAPARHGAGHRPGCLTYVLCSALHRLDTEGTEIPYRTADPPGGGAGFFRLRWRRLRPEWQRQCQ
jgi:hypothetical protein